MLQPRAVARDGQRPVRLLHPDLVLRRQRRGGRKRADHLRHQGCQVQRRLSGGSLRTTIAAMLTVQLGNCVLGPAIDGAGAVARLAHGGATLGIAIANAPLYLGPPAFAFRPPGADAGQADRAAASSARSHKTVYQIDEILTFCLSHGSATVD